MKHAKKLEEMGIPKEQAEAQIQIIADIMEENLASKRDMFMLKQDILMVKQDIGQLRIEMGALENRIIIKVGWLMGFMLTLAVAVLSLLTHR